MLSIDLVGRRAIFAGVTSEIGISIVKALQGAGTFVIGVGWRSLPPSVAPDDFVQGDVRPRGAESGPRSPWGRRRARRRSSSTAPRCCISRGSRTRTMKRSVAASTSMCRDLSPSSEIWRRADIGGAVVNISSTASATADLPTGAYAATKDAVANLTRVAAAEYGGCLRVNSVCPGHTRTPLVVVGWQSDSEERFSRVYPNGRIGEPEDVANVVPSSAVTLRDSFTVRSGWSTED